MEYIPILQFPKGQEANIRKLNQKKKEKKEKKKEPSGFNYSLIIAQVFISYAY